MPLQDRLIEDLKDAMRKGDALRRSVIRFARAEIQNEEIALQAGLDDDGVIKVLSRLAQQRRDSIEAFEKGGRDDLVEKEKAELAVVLGYLPEQLSRDEIVAAVKSSIEEIGATGPGDMGKVMGHVVPRVRGRAEGREVSAVAAELLKHLGG